MLRQIFDKLYTGSREDFVRAAAGALDRGERLFVVTANPEIMMAAARDEELARALLREDAAVVPDGIGVVKAAEHLGKDMHGRVTGVELSWALISHAMDRGQSLYLYGAREEVLQALLARIRREWPEARIAGGQNGYGGDDEAVFRDVLDKRPDLVLVALGVPRQEKLIARWLDRFPKGVFVGVGGAFDVLSGAKKRAPDWMIRLNLEWLYRIAREPKRLGRFARGNLSFLGQVWRMKK